MIADTNARQFITEGDKTLAHHLQALGYKTGLVGKNHVIEAKGLHRFPDFHADPQSPDIEENADQLYNLDVDPDELNNLAHDAQCQGILMQLKAELTKYLDDLPGKFDL